MNKINSFPALLKPPVSAERQRHSASYIVVEGMYIPTKRLASKLLTTSTK